MERITIIGLGLIGGSLGLALKRANLTGVEIAGHDRDAETAGRARQRGAIDKVEWSIIGAVQDASMVIVATPVRAVREVFSLIAEHLPEQCIITDTASTKAQVMQWAEELLPKTVHFVGGHPMAGKETSGINAAEASLFQESLYCIVPSSQASQGAIESVMGLARTVGAIPYFVDAHEHDGFAAGISHLPMVLSAALVSTVSKSPAWREMAKLASSGFRDISRLASGDTEMSRDICLTNHESLVRWIDTCIEELQRYRRLIADQDDLLERALIEAKLARDKWEATKGRVVEEGAPVEIPTAGQAMSEVFFGRGLPRLFEGPKKEKKP